MDRASCLDAGRCCHSPGSADTEEPVHDNQHSTNRPSARERTDILAAALDAVALGLSVLPLYRPIVEDGELVGCTCGDPLTHGVHGRGAGRVGKHPAAPHGVKDASTVESAVRAWFAAGDRNVGVAMGARVGDHMAFALDADTPEAADRLRSLGLVQHTLSGRGGACGHFLVRLPIGFKPHLGDREVDVIGPGKYIVWPPSLHRSGEHYRVVTPLRNLGELPVLPEHLTTADPAWRECAVPAVPPREVVLPGLLGASAHKALVEGVTAMGSRNPSVVLLAALTGMVSNGWTETQAVETLLDVRLPGGRSLRQRCELPGDQVQVWWRRTFEKATARVANNPAIYDTAAALATVMAAREWAERRSWSRRSNARAVLLGFLELCARLGSIHQVSWSCREAAEACGLSSWTTARDNLRHLVDLGVLERVDQEDLHRATGDYGHLTPQYFNLRAPCFATDEERAAWRHGLESRDFAHSNPTVVGCLSVGMGEHPRSVGSGWDEEALVAHDLFRSPSRTCRGLGKIKARVLFLLDEHTPRTTRDLAKELGHRSTSSTREHLLPLHALGLITDTPDGWTRQPFTIEDLDRIAAERGTAGRGEAMVIRHLEERAGFTAALGKRTDETIAEEFVATALVYSPGTVVLWPQVASANRSYVLDWRPGPRTRSKWTPTPVSDRTLAAMIARHYPEVIVEWKPGPMRWAERFIHLDLADLTTSPAPAHTEDKGHHMTTDPIHPSAPRSTQMPTTSPADLRR